MERQVREGMIVRSADGEKLGKVTRCGADEFVIEKGFFFPKDYVARYDQATVSGDEVLLSIPAASLRDAGEASGVAREREASGLGTELGTYAVDTTGRPIEGGERGGERRESRTTRGATEDVRVPIAEEEVVAEKREREAGEIRVRKDVTTEHRQVDVPVTREEVHVERVPVEGGDARAAEARFEQDEVRVPVREEEVEIRKRPVVKEEVRVSKTPRTVEQRADAEVRREEVRIEREGDVPEGSDRGDGSVKEPEQ